MRTWLLLFLVAPPFVTAHCGTFLAVDIGCTNAHVSLTIEGTMYPVDELSIPAMVAFTPGPLGMATIFGHAALQQVRGGAARGCGPMFVACVLSGIGQPKQHFLLPPTANRRYCEWFLRFFAPSWPSVFGGERQRAPSAQQRNDRDTDIRGRDITPSQGDKATCGGPRWARCQCRSAHHARAVHRRGTSAFHPNFFVPFFFSFSFISKLILF